MDYWGPINVINCIHTQQRANTKWTGSFIGEFSFAGRVWEAATFDCQTCKAQQLYYVRK
jgi:hypothetical protein